MKYAFQSDIGTRSKNEDSCYVPEPDERHALVIVADGMGGHSAGMVASGLAIREVSGYENAGLSNAQWIRLALHAANSEIFRSAKADKSLCGMGTTITLALLEPTCYTAANIGDSRLYHYCAKSSQLRQITRDHSYVAHLVEQGEITPEQAAVHPHRNVITRALGTQEYDEPDLFYECWQEGDILLLCSDGLHGSLPDEHIRQILSSDLSLQEKCDALVSKALLFQATDNVTAVLALNETEGD